MIKKYSIDNLTQKDLLFKQFVNWSCDGCSAAPLTDYIHNRIYQELMKETDYFRNKSNERIYLDLRASAGYTNQMEKWEQNDSKITKDIKDIGLFTGRIFISACTRLFNIIYMFYVIKHIELHKKTTTF